MFRKCLLYTIWFRIAYLAYALKIHSGTYLLKLKVINSSPYPIKELHNELEKKHFIIYRNLSKIRDTLFICKDTQIDFTS